MPPSSSSSKNCRYDQQWQPQLPDECWESIFKHLTHHPHDLESLSLVSRHFLSLTNSLLTHLTVSEHVLPLLPALLRRFPNLISIKLMPYISPHIDALLSQIASFDLPFLHSLDISNQFTFPSHGLRQFSQKFPTLKSLNCSYTRPDLVLIAECFPNLEEIDVSVIRTPVSSDKDLQVKALTSGLKKLRKVKISGSESVEIKLKWIIDVRDLADALILAYEKIEACPAMPKDLVHKLKIKYPNYNYPTKFIVVDCYISLCSEKLETWLEIQATREETLIDYVESYKKPGLLEFVPLHLLIDKKIQGNFREYCGNKNVKKLREEY